MNVLVTGANGFVGRALCSHLRTIATFDVVGCVRKIDGFDDAQAPIVAVGDLTAETNWSNALVDVDVIVHAAARVHVMNDIATDPLAAFRKVNVEGTLNLARQAAAAGVRRFVFISSIKVNGEGTALGKPYRADDIPAPTDPYGISKMEAEQGLFRVAAETGMEVTVIRPVLVYGPGVKANFLSMMKWLSKGVPLPLGAIHNKRSLVALDNLVDLIVTCLDHPAAANQVFMVSDGADLSMTQLLKLVGEAFGRPARLLPVPAIFLTLLAAILGKRDVARRLCGSLQVDIAKTRELLGWQPPLTVQEGLKKVAEGMRK